MESRSGSEIAKSLIDKGFLTSRRNFGSPIFVALVGVDEKKDDTQKAEFLGWADVEN